LLRKKGKEIYYKNHSLILIKQRNYKKLNKEKSKETASLYYLKNKEKLSEKSRLWKIKNKERLNKRRNIQVKERRSSDPIEKTRYALRNSIRQSFKRMSWRKGGRSEELLGATYVIVKQHIERQFKKGMNWTNHGRGVGKWNIDHKIPLASAKTKEDLTALCHYRNLQPLWAIDNIKKSDKILPIQVELTI